MALFRIKTNNGWGGGPGYREITYTLSANLTATNNGTDTVDIFKTSGSNSWDNHAYSDLSFTAPCTIEFNKQAGATDNSSSYAMIAWNEDPETNAREICIVIKEKPGDNLYIKERFQLV